MNILIVGTGLFSQALSHCLQKHTLSFLSRTQIKESASPVYNSFPNESFDLIILGIPRNSIKTFIDTNAKSISTTPILFVSKGFDEHCSYDPVDNYPHLKNQALYFLGPNLASEILASCPTYSVLCSYNKDLLKTYLSLFQETSFLSCEPYESPREILLGCALKNIYTLGYGYVEKMQSYNASALYFVESLDEIQKWYQIFSLNFTFHKAIIGDYFVSCVGPSRNKTHGLNFPNQSEELLEGLISLKNLYNQYPNQFPLFEKLYRIFHLDEHIPLL
jgi:glycerol-3-phosphate dehydrogenase